MQSVWQVDGHVCFSHHALFRLLFLSTVAFQWLYHAWGDSVCNSGPMPVFVSFCCQDMACTYSGQTALEACNQEHTCTLATITAHTQYPYLLMFEMRNHRSICCQFLICIFQQGPTLQCSLVTLDVHTGMHTPRLALMHSWSISRMSTCI